VAARLGVPPPSAGPTDLTAVTGVTLDSRAVRPGDLYAALPGAYTHGADYAAQAAAAGAAAALTDPAGASRVAAAGLPAYVVPAPRAHLGELAAWLYGDASAHLVIVGVTGTNGKTTTSYLMEAGLRRAGHVTGLVGTIETRIGAQVLPSVRTTPEAPDLQALLAVMRERGVTAVVMEVSSHALALGRVDGTVFAAAAFTNLSQDHLDFHGTLEDYYAAKASLFVPARARRAVIDVDDAYGARLARESSVPLRTVSTVTRGSSDWWIDRLEPFGAGGHAFALHGPSGLEVPAGVGLPGLFNVANAVLALATLAAVDVDPAVAAPAVAELAIPGRMERVRPAQAASADVLAVVDYAHTPDAVEAALRTLRATTRGRLTCVLGCGGDRDRGKRARMGEVAARCADRLVVTDDNPRSEDPVAIRAAMLAGALTVPAAERAEVLEIPGRAAAIAAAVRDAHPGDTVLVAGKGHETGQEIAGVVHEFDDRSELRHALDSVIA
jgi:UDP-N-acetylmuramoyl-L-alanyl-D-glutamate--2,6-diaminopimelate ligase